MLDRSSTMVSFNTEAPFPVPMGRMPMPKDVSLLPPTPRGSTEASSESSSASPHEQQPLENMAICVTPQRCDAPAAGALARTKSQFSMSSALSSFSSSSGCSLAPANSHMEVRPCQEEDFSMSTFGMSLRRYAGEPSAVPNFDRGMRQVMERYLRKARLEREKTRSQDSLLLDASIASAMGVPYVALRQERPFLFDEHSFPLHTALANSLKLSDLTKIHEVDEAQALMPLLDPEQRIEFHRVYDNFVTSFCIPLLHSMAIAKKIFHDHSRAGHDCITYRYQAFPSINVVRPGATAKPPTCGVSQGHSLGCLFFHIPLTPSQGTSALYVESYPGREDWHPLQAKSVGLGFLYDGGRCLQFGLENTNPHSSRISLDFCIMIYRENPECSWLSSSTSSYSSPFSVHTMDASTSTNLCTPDLLDDDFSREAPHYYEEACIDLNRTIALGTDAVVRKSRTLQEPHRRVGPPFERP
jgi:hypothetical protein